MKPQLFVHGEEPDPEKFDKVQNREAFWKPKGGLWTSTLDGDSSAWIDWCKRERWGLSEGMGKFALYPEDDVDVFVVDVYDDLEQLVEDYPRDIQFPRPLIDFEKMAEDYDGMQVTERGQAETRFGKVNLYGWDCESTFWFNWCFEDVDYLGEVDI